ncbi:MAG: L-serine ammonia-lyase, iron-sulfur-dependent, subunit alpha [bacterium]
MKINSFNAAIESSKELDLKLFEVFQQEESLLNDFSISEIRNAMSQNLDIMSQTIKNGLKNPSKSITGLSGDDSIKVIECTDEFLPFGADFKKIIAYALAVMEENLSMGKIVACPTAGSCGIVPAAIITYSEKFNIFREKQIDALITAGGVGKIISKKIALSGAVAGCQAECGVASAMAAAAIVEMANGTNEQIVEAVALALKNIMGLVCDPIAGMVEIPCMKRNAFLSVHAFVAAQMVMCNIKSAVPADEVVDAMKQVGILMSPMLKECSQAGLATTNTGLDVQRKLNS